jgi:hypothetical protein
MNTGVHRLNHLWSAWVRVVDDVVRRRRRARHLTEEEYQELHTELLAEITAQIQRCKSVEHSLPKEMLPLASPWITLDSLFAAERHVQSVLLGQIKRAQRRLLQRTGPQRRWVLIAIPLVGILITGLVVTGVISMWDSGDLARTVRQSQHWAYRLQRAVIRADLLTKIGVFALIVLASGAFFLRSMRQD